MSGDTLSFEGLKRQTLMQKPHVVILGAGASVAAFPEGKLPVMANLVGTLGLESLLEKAALEHRGGNFEDIYNQLSRNASLSKVREAVEQRVAEYFSKLDLPEHPTIYDYLVLSLRKKDVIATFNWDPFLWLACQRNHDKTRLPHIFFLHGCAIIGYCSEHKVQGRVGTLCPTCGRPYTPTRLLYPVANKDYVTVPYIASQWRSLRSAFRTAYILTIFGYGAPESDAAAVDLMSEAWGSPEERDLEEIEIVDIKDQEELEATWNRFIHTHHFRAANSYFESLLGAFPRRTCEAIWAELMEVKFLEYARVPKFERLAEMWEWFQQLVAYEHETGSSA